MNFEMYGFFRIICLFSISTGNVFGAIDIRNIRSEIIEAPESFGECGHQYLNLDFKTQLTMLDASSKLEIDGILQGNFFNLGSYDECLAIHNEKNDIFGKYCLATLSVEDMIKLLYRIFPPHMNISSELIYGTEQMRTQKRRLGIISKQPSLLGYHFGICVPHRCSATNLTSVIPFLTYDEGFCYSAAPSNGLETGVIITLSIFGIVFVLVICSTLYDVLLSDLVPERRFDILIAFSAFTNGKELLKSSRNPNQLLCINGLKSLNMMWVVLGHTVAHFGLSTAMSNWKVISPWLDNPWNMLFISATLSVDSFFTIGGILTVYTYMRSPTMEVKESVQKLPMLYLHRYIRLTPAFSVVVLAYATGTIKYISDGPLWGSMDELLGNACEKYWWSSLLYIQNYYYGTVCVDQSWYLAVDMQLFLLTPFLLIPLRRWPRKTLFAIFILVLLGIVIPFWVGYTKKISGLALGSTGEAFTYDYYYNTYTRFGPYVIGMLAGYYIFKVKNEGVSNRYNRVAVIFAWILTLTVFLICIFDGFKLVTNTDDALADGFYLGLNRSAWSAALASLIILCVSGNGGFVNTFLSLPMFEIIAKLSYSIYLVHLLIIATVNLSSRDPINFSSFIIVYRFFGNFILSLIVSVIFYLLFDSPFAAIMRLIFPRNKKRN